MSAKPNLIYEPRGRALEYAPLACNLAVGCIHGCRYCYGPASFRVAPGDWTVPLPKADLLGRFARSAERFAGDPREILFSFATDPFGTVEQVRDFREILPLAEAHRLRLTVLTKNPEAAEEFLPAFARNGWSLGATVCFLSEEMRAEWEPGAPSIASRLAGLARARALGVRTWASVEPVLDAAEGLRAIEALRDRVDLVKVGKWNHDARAAAISWPEFLAAAARLLAGRPHLFKHDLLAAGGYVEGADGVWTNGGLFEPGPGRPLTGQDMARALEMNGPRTPAAPPPKEG